MVEERKTRRQSPSFPGKQGIAFPESFPDGTQDNVEKRSRDSQIEYPEIFLSLIVGL